MAYKKQTFSDGNTLSADELNYIEEGIFQNSINVQGAKADIETLKSQANPNLNLLVLGDSIFGGRNGIDWLETLGYNLQNYAVGGASIAEISEKKRVDGTYSTLLDQFQRFKARVAPIDYENKQQPKTDWTATFEKPDAILLCGGGNDYLSASVLGDMTLGKHLYPSIYANATYDKSTVVGALHTLLRDISMTYPEAQRFFLIMHRVYQCDDNTLQGEGRKCWAVRDTYARVPYTRTENGKSVTTWEILFNQANQMLTSATEIRAATGLRVRSFKEGVDVAGNGYIDYGVASDFDQNSIYSSGTHPTGTFDATKFQGRYTYDELREVIVKICNMYGFKIIDIYNDSLLNVVPPSTRIENETEIAVANSEFLDWRGIHPTVKGYQLGYEPYVKAALRLATKKGDTA